ncbi:MAG TPA: hypothetical protein VGM24_08100 [Puia sp.]|jgi:hypothetical protein
MKTILILSNIAFLAVLIIAPVLRKINLFRLITLIMLTIYSIVVVKLIFLFPVPCLFSLVAGMLAVLSMVFLFRPRSVPEAKGNDHKIRILHWHHQEIKAKKEDLKYIAFKSLGI